MKTIALTVKGMTCNHCVMNVQKALMNIEGVHSAEVSLKDGRAVVKGDGFQSEALKKAVEDIGYSVQIS
jgi:copper ion binding protein